MKSADSLRRKRHGVDNPVGVSAGRSRAGGARPSGMRKRPTAASQGTDRSRTVSFTLKERIRVVEKGALGATIQFSLKVSNPNSVPVTLQQMKYDVAVGSNHLGKSQAGPRTTIPAGAEAIVPLRMNVSYVSSGAGVLEAISNEQIALKLGGTALIACASNKYDCDPLDFPIILK